MPIYKYKCEKCGYVFTLLRDLNDSSEVKCEKCGGSAKKMISSVAVKFNAPGFYSTTVKNTDSGKGNKESENKTKNNSSAKKEGN
jgi:putative FmdB family regulatory protein